MSSIYKYQTFNFTGALCALEKKQVRAEAVITLIVGLCCFFCLLFSGPLYGVVTSSVGPAAVYYSPDLICLADDWAALNPC